MRLDVEIDRVQYLLSGLTHPQIRRIDDNAVEIGRGCYFHARYHVISLRSRMTILVGLKPYIDIVPAAGGPQM